MEETIKEIEEITPGAEAVPKPKIFLRLPRRALIAILAVAAVVAIFVLFISFPLLAVYRDGQKAAALGQQIAVAAKAQDLKKTSEAITATKIQVQLVRKDLDGLAWLRFVPFLGSYVSDAVHLSAAGQYGLEAGEIMTVAAEPYADILGLKGQGSFTGGTAEDRISKAIETLDKITPQIDSIAEKMVLVGKEIDQVDPSRYPDTFFGKPVRSRVVEAKEIVSLANEVFTSARPMVKKLPELLGTKGEAKYMVLFQNDKEIRPTGGFITAYAVFRIEKGKIILESSDDIYKLDDTVTRHVTPPDPIVRYLNVFGWRLRDANFSPDFLSSMKTFEDIYAGSTAKKALSGIVAVDTQMLTMLMDVLGPVDVYGTSFTTQKVSGCDCPMVIYELLKQAGTPRNYWTDNRKDMVGVLLQAIMRKALDAPSEMNAKIFQAIMTAAAQKHILIYLHEPDAQKGVEALELAGRIKTSTGTDYLHISDANLGGAKSNLYVVESVKQDVAINSNGAETSLTIEYKYPHSADNCSLERKEGLCLAGIYRDYLRVYLPKGATVDSATGFENKSRTFEDLGHTVIDGYFTVVPQGLAKITVKYKVPGDFLKNREYVSLIQKQPGTNAIHYVVTVNGKAYPFDLVTDKNFSAPL
ncbi:DUF4012 domain-containing protein [Candidatus Microgenomates bacterium]|nr:DUF4012 domain-containing protein [Candidatus Microgenomates bacterium]